MLTEGNQVRNEAIKGNITEIVDYMKAYWPVECGERVMSEIGNDEQEYTRVEFRKGVKFEVPVKGWKEILATTGYGIWSKGDLTAYVVMVDGGRNHVRKLENVKLYVGLYQNGKNLTDGKGIEIFDDIDQTRSGPKWIYTLKRSAFDKLLEFLDTLKVEEETETNVDEKGIHVEKKMKVKRGRRKSA